jgi:hypothetical protein
MRTSYPTVAVDLLDHVLSLVDQIARCQQLPTAVVRPDKGHNCASGLTRKILSSRRIKAQDQAKPLVLSRDPAWVGSELETPFERNRRWISCFALATRFRISSTERKPTRYCASLAVSAQTAMPKISMSSFAYLSFSFLSVTLSGCKDFLRPALTSTKTSSINPPCSWM